MQPKLIMFGLVLASILLFGCTLGAQPAQNVTNETPAPVEVVKTPTFTIASPTPGQVVTMAGSTADVTLTVSYQNLALKPPGGAAKKGEGHFRVTVDSGQPATVSTRNYIMANLAPGAHTAKVELLNNDRTKYVPAIEKTVSFVVESEEPAVYVPVSYEVTINSFVYTPSEVNAKVGDSITFTNTGAFPMSATCFIAGKQVFDTRVLAINQAATVTLDQEMDCTYYSTTQRSATGRVVVTANSTG
jgi:plastocyanin